MIPTIVNSITGSIVALTTIFLSMAIFRLTRHVQRLEQRVMAAEKTVGRLKCLKEQPKGDVYRIPPAECAECPESNPAACQACYEEEEAYIRRGV